MHTHRGIGRIPGLTITEFIRVLVLDARTIDVIQKTLAKDDYALVEGWIQYKPYENRGKRAHSGYIVAKAVHRFEK